MIAEEVVEVYDEHGQQTGEVVSLSEAHKRELWHRLVFVWVYNDQGEVVLQKRDLSSHVYPGRWDISAGGHPSAGETWEEGAAKEAIEEVNVAVDAQDLEFAHQDKDETLTTSGHIHKAYYRIYIAKFSGDAGQLKPQEGEVADVKWMAAAQVLAECKDPETAEQYTPRDAMYEIPLRKILERVH